MLDDIPSLTIRSGTLKGRITKFLKFLQDFSIDGDVSQIRVRKQKIEECWDEFQNIQSAIEIKVTDEAAVTTEENYRGNYKDYIKLCTNCLSKHKENKCKAKGCRKCGEHHNTLLHENVSESNAESAPTTSINAHAASTPSAKVLLFTAIIKMFSSSDEPFLVRALLDSVSQGNFITNNLVSKLRITKQKFDCTISEVNAAECRVSHLVAAVVQARSGEYTRSINFMTLPKITSKLPASPINVNNSYTIPEYIEYADPSYATPGEIDLLLGAEVFFDTLRSGQFRPIVNGPIYQETAFG
ncbi:hypothetical protein QTP88_007075 [Uroleucon formosanum]